MNHSSSSSRHHEFLKYQYCSQNQPNVTNYPFFLPIYFFVSVPIHLVYGSCNDDAINKISKFRRKSERENKNWNRK